MNKTSLYYLEHLDAFKIMQSHIMDRVMQEYWQSDLDASGSLMGASTAYSILTQNDSRNVIDYELQHRFYKSRDKKEVPPHKFNFVVVRQSMEVRYFLEMTLFFLLVCTFQRYLTYYSKSSNILKQEANAMHETNEDLSENALELLE